MNDWLSATWEANWRPFQYFIFFRLVLVGLFFVAAFFPYAWLSHLDLRATPALFAASGLYACGVLGGLLLAVHWQQRFDLQLTLQVLIDIAAVSALLAAAGGVGSGLAVLLIVSLAAASLVGRGRLVLFYAALATLAVLATQIRGVLAYQADQNSLVQAGFICAGFFATAILARLLGQRVMINEDLARRRGIALDNQIRISQRVVERMQDGVLIVDREGGIVRSNPGAQAMLGLPAGVAVPDLAAVAPALAAALAAWQGGAPALEAPFASADGRELSARFEATSSSDGEVLVFLEDVGRIKERAQQLKLAALGRLTASIAHEIRNPLSAISHAGELLREERRGEMQDRLLRILNDNVGRLDRIVRDVLEIGRQSRPEPEAIELAGFCRNFVERLVATEHLAPDVVAVLADGETAFCFDRAHLDQVLWNLVGNALRHAGRMPGAVRLRLAAGNADGRVELHVEDSGPGIPEAVREQVFEPFFTTHHQGTGLGLFIARELCAANGAGLELLAAAGGAHFVITGRNDTCQLPETNAGPAAI